MNSKKVKYKVSPCGNVKRMRVLLGYTALKSTPQKKKTQFMNFKCTYSRNTEQNSEKCELLAD